MDTQDFRSLQEAYMEVVMGEGYKEFPHEKVKAKEKKVRGDIDKKMAEPAVGQSRKEISNEIKGIGKSRARATKLSLASKFHHSAGPQHREKVNKTPESPLYKKRSKTVSDSYDYYDIILSHLLDEGYAETPEAAEAIMVNMSEEWRDSIIG
jgi:hypothetical protein